MAPKGGSGGKGIVTGGGGGGGDGDDHGLSAGEKAAIAIGILVGPFVLWFIWAVIMDGLQKLRGRIQRRAKARMEQGASVELGQQLPTQGQPEQAVATPEPTYPRYDKILHSSSPAMTYPTTPAYDTNDLYRPN